MISRISKKMLFISLTRRDETNERTDMRLNHFHYQVSLCVHSDQLNVCKKKTLVRRSFSSVCVSKEDNGLSNEECRRCLYLMNLFQMFEKIFNLTCWLIEIFRWDNEERKGTFFTLPRRVWMNVCLLVGLLNKSMCIWSTHVEHQLIFSSHAFRSC